MIRAPHMKPNVPNHYATLGLHRRCTVAQIRRAYRLLAKQHHPDVNPESADALARIQALNAAYETLCDATRREAYDRDLDQEEPDAVPVRSRSRSAPEPISKDIQIGLQDFLRGVTLTVGVNDPARTDGPESYTLVVPPETAPGTRFRLKRDPPFERGWVVIRVKARPDLRFKVRGSDLRCDLKINARRAVQGGPESVRGLTGNFITVPIPPGVARGEIVRMAGEGLPKPRGGRGDLLVRICYRVDVRVTRTQ